MRTYEITSPSGRTFEISAPDEATQEEVLAFAQKYTPKSAQEPAKGGVLDAVKDDLKGIPGKLGNLAAGALRGAGSIGATILAPVDMAKDALDGKGLSLESNRQRRTDMDSTLRDFGADPESIQYRVGKVGAEIAGTAGAGGVVGNTLRAVAPGSRAAQVAATAIESGGFRTGAQMGKTADIATRAAGGAVAGAAGAGLANPDDAATGAVIGGAIPVAAKLGGQFSEAAFSLLRAARTPEEVKIARQLAEQLGVTAGDIAAVRTGPQVIPGYEPTLPQILQTPEASQLQRTLKTAGGNALGEAEKLQQQQFRQTLEGVAPIGNTVQDSANVAGNAIQDFAVPAERDASRNVSALFEAVPPAEATMQLPLAEMQAAQTRYLGPGSFGKGGASVEQAMQTATHVGTDPLTHGVDARAVPFDQIQALRSSIGEALTEAQTKGHTKAAGALTTMKNAIDNKIADVAAGNALPGEVFTPEAIDTWGQALAAHSAKKQQFATGPQATMFRKGADGQPAIQGAEIPGKFFNGNRSQVEDVQAFKRLVQNRADLMGVMKGYALTEGAATSNQAGDLTQKFLNWMESRSGATRELFTPDEMHKITAVGRALEKSLTAENLGRVSGSDTAQKLASLQKNGLLDSKAVDFLARRIPGIGSFTGPALDALRARATATRQDTMANLLANPGRMEEALRKGQGATPASYGTLPGPAARALPVLGAGAMSAEPATAAPPPPQPAMDKISQATTVDEAIAGAMEAVNEPAPATTPIAVSQAPMPAEPVSEVTAQADGSLMESPVATTDAGQGSDQPAAIWTGRRGDGYIAAGDALMAMRTRQKVEPDLEWKVERMPNDKFRLAGYARGDDPALMQAEPLQAQLNPTGTASIFGDSATIAQTLRANGITGFVPVRGGVMVSVSQAPRAMQLAAA